MIIEVKGRSPIFNAVKKLLINKNKKLIREEASKESLLLFDIHANEVEDGWLKVDKIQLTDVNGEVKMAVVIKNKKIYMYELDNKGVFWWYEF